MNANTAYVEHAFAQYGEGLHRYLMRRLMNCQNARDVSQDAYLRLLKVKDAELIRAPQAYLYRIASNLIYEMQLRERRDHVSFDSRVAEHAADSNGNLTATEQCDRVELEQWLQQILDQLPPLYAAILVMKKRDGKSLAEIARELGLSVHTVKKYLFKAVVQCRAFTRDRLNASGRLC